MDAHELFGRALEAMRNTEVSRCLSDYTLKVFAREAAIFASRFAGECIKELQPRVEPDVKVD